jgi:hypothetical protein
MYGVGDLRLEEAPTPKPGPGEVAIDVKAVGICASDVHYYRHGGIGGLTAAAGFILGHDSPASSPRSAPPRPPPAPTTSDFGPRTSDWRSAIA